MTPEYKKRNFTQTEMGHNGAVPNCPGRAQLSKKQPKLKSKKMLNTNRESLHLKFILEKK